MRYIPKSKYIPTTDEVETAFHEFASSLESKWPGEYTEAPEFADWVEAMHGFKRWYAEEIREAKEEAWGQGRVSGGSNAVIQPNPYRKETE